MLQICRMNIRKLLLSHRYSTIALPIPATGVKLSNAARSCELVSKTGHVIGTYPYVWLRDNCRCSQCFHPPSRGRLMLMANLDPDIIPAKAEINISDQELNIQWPDKHTSKFPLAWLRENQFSKMPTDPVSEPSQRFWGSEMQDKIPSFMFKDVHKSDQSLHDWIESLQVYGLALIKEAPKQKGVVKEIGNRISFLRPTIYGRETYQIISKVDASNAAYTSHTLGLHSDLTNYAYMPNASLIVDPCLILWDILRPPYLKMPNDDIFSSVGFYVMTCQRVRDSKQIATIADFHLMCHFHCVSTRLFKSSMSWQENSELHIQPLPFVTIIKSKIQMMHCIKQVSVGGENQFCDVFKVAEDLRRKSPEVFHILSTTPIDFRDCGTDIINSFHLKYSRPTIELFPDGRYEAVNYSDQARAPYQSIPVEDVYKVYRALKTLFSEINKQENKIEIKMVPGDVITFDNRRVFHARSGFTVTESDSRHLEGAYMDWDEVRSRRRVIRDQLLKQQPL